MKLLLLLIFPLISLGQTFTPNGDLIVPKERVPFVYKSMKSGAEYKLRFEQCQSAVKTMYDNAKIQDSTVNGQLEQLQELGVERDELQQAKTDQTAKLQKLSDKKYFGVGFSGGATWNGKIVPYIGVGVNYDLFRF